MINIINIKDRIGCEYVDRIVDFDTFIKGIMSLKDDIRINTEITVIITDSRNKEEVKK